MSNDNNRNLTIHSRKVLWTKNFLNCQFSIDIMGETRNFKFFDFRLVGLFYSKLQKPALYLRGIKYRTIVTIAKTINANHERNGTQKLKTFAMLSRMCATIPRAFCTIKVTSCIACISVNTVVEFHSEAGEIQCIFAP